MASSFKKIMEFNKNAPEHLMKIKLKALAESPFRFYRGTAHLFAEDFSTMSSAKPKIKVWLCGDLHLENFGSYKGENRLVYFDLNDFDESVLGMPEAEMARFVTSILISSEMMDVSPIITNKIVREAVDAYVEAIAKRKAYMLESELAHGVFKKYFEQVSTRDRQEFIGKRTDKHKGHLRLKIDDIHFLEIDNDLKNSLFDTLTGLLSKQENYENFVFSDAAFRIAGTGSLGLERYCVLCYSKTRGKHYLLDVKEAGKPCLAPFTDAKQPKFKHDAERIITAGNLLQFSPPAFLSAVEMKGKWFMVKELQPVSDKMSLPELGSDPKSFALVTAQMGRLAAYAHLRSSGHFGASTADELVDYVTKKMDVDALVEVCYELAKKNKKYFKEFNDKMKKKGAVKDNEASA